MNSFELQQLLKSPDSSGTINLPSGEFEGPFVIDRPCRVKGNSTTLWRGKGAILTVTSPNVVLENLRIEITNDNLPPTDNVSVLSQAHDTEFVNIEVIGRIVGIEGEDDPWGIPKMIELGKFPAEEQCTYMAEIIVPVETEIISIFHDISVLPSRLSAGLNTVTLTTAAIRNGSYIYGELLFRSRVTRRVYLSGSADESITDFENNQLIFKADGEALAAEEKALEQLEFEEEIIYPEIIAPPPEKNEMYKPEISEDEPHESQPLYIINRGMSIPITCSEAEIELIYDNKDFPMDVDAFAFMANKHGNVTQNDRFVFFGNDHSLCGGVRYLNAPDKKVLYVNFNVLPLDISEIDIAYSIYENPMWLNFSSLVNPAISIKLSNGQQLIYQLERPLGENTLVGLEITYAQSRWTLTPLGMIYPLGLSNLCGNYGLKIT